MKKNLLSLLLLAVFVILVIAVSNQASDPVFADDMIAAEDGRDIIESEEDSPVYQIGVLQLTSHPALDEANLGFFAALNDAGIKYVTNQQNAFGEYEKCAMIAEELIKDKSDLILAISTPAAQAVAARTESIPILVTASLDPFDSGLVDSNDNPGRNVSGTSDRTPVGAQIELLIELVPDVSNVGIIIYPEEINSVIEARTAGEVLGAAGISHTDYIISEYKDIQTTVKSMLGKVDAVYIPTSYMIEPGMEMIGTIACEYNLPVICGNSGMMANGVLATCDIDYYQLGYITGEQAIAILRDNKDIAMTPIGYLPAERCKVIVNMETAKVLGIDTSKIDY